MFSDAAYLGGQKTLKAQPRMRWNIALRPGQSARLDKTVMSGKLLDQLEHTKARIRAKVEHPFRLLKRQFGHVTVRYRGLINNTVQLHTLFAPTRRIAVAARLQNYFAPLTGASVKFSTASGESCTGITDATGVAGRNHDQGRFLWLRRQYFRRTSVSADADPQLTTGIPASGARPLHPAVTPWPDGAHPKSVAPRQRPSFTSRIAVERSSSATADMAADSKSDSAAYR